MIIAFLMVLTITGRLEGKGGMGPNVLAPLFALVGASALFLELVQPHKERSEVSLVFLFLGRSVAALCAFLAAWYWLDLGQLNPCVVGRDNHMAIIYVAVISGLVAAGASSAPLVALIIGLLRSHPNKLRDQSDGKNCEFEKP